MPRIERSEIDTHIGTQLRKLRQHCDMSMAEISNYIGVSCQQIQKYECGKNKIAASLLYRITSLYDVEMDFFFEDLK